MQELHTHQATCPFVFRACGKGLCEFVGIDSDLKVHSESCFKMTTHPHWNDRYHYHLIMKNAQNEQDRQSRQQHDRNNARRNSSSAPQEEHNHERHDPESFSSESNVLSAEIQDSTAANGVIEFHSKHECPETSISDAENVQIVQLSELDSSIPLLENVGGEIFANMTEIVSSEGLPEKNLSAPRDRIDDDEHSLADAAQKECMEKNTYHLSCYRMATAQRSESTSSHMTQENSSQRTSDLQCPSFSSVKIKSEPEYFSSFEKISEVIDLSNDDSEDEEEFEHSKRSLEKSSLASASSEDAESPKSRRRLNSNSSKTLVKRAYRRLLSFLLDYPNIKDSVTKQRLCTTILSVSGTDCVSGKEELDHLKEELKQDFFFVDFSAYLIIDLVHDDEQFSNRQAFDIVIKDIDGRLKIFDDHKDDTTSSSQMGAFQNNQ